MTMAPIVPLVPPTAELFTKAQLATRHPHLLSANRLAWALRRRAANGLSSAVFESPCGELLIHEPVFLAWFLGLNGRSKPRAARKGRHRSIAVNQVPLKQKSGGGTPFSGTHTAEKANRELCCTPDASSCARKVAP